MKAKTYFSVLGLLAGITPVTIAQTPTIVHNTWSSGAPIPTAVYSPAVGVVAGQIYVVGGVDANGSLRADTQIYNPATNSWSAGTPLPTPVYSASAAVVNNILYVIGGDTVLGQPDATNAVWAYSPKTKTWSSKTAIPMARYGAGAIAENNLIYVVDGENGYQVLSDVESYNPATAAWTQEAPLNDTTGTWFAAGLLGSRLSGFTIVIADGGASGEVSNLAGGYNASTNSWEVLADDLVARFGPCSGGIGNNLYVAGGWNSNGVLTQNDSFNLPKNAWKTRAPMSTGAFLIGSATYQGRLYCIGGVDKGGNPLNTVQIYQP